MDLDALSEAFKTVDITQEAGRLTLDENPTNLPKGGESTVAGASPDQKVKKRKNSECGKRVKKRKLKGMVHSLRAIGEENEQNKSQNDFMKQNLQRMQEDIEMQKAEFCVSQNKTITAQENLVETLCQELSVQHLMAGSNKLDVVQYAMSFPNADRDVRMPSKANQSLDGITELKNRYMVLDMKTEFLCEMIINGKPEE